LHGFIVLSFCRCPSLDWGPPTPTIPGPPILPETSPTYSLALHSSSTQFKTSGRIAKWYLFTY
jgi:hypothetical protein